MEKYADVLLWLIVPLLVILPFAAYAETVRCKTELKRLCDSAQVCTKTSTIHPAVEYVIDLPNDPRTVKISKMVGGRRVTSWKADLLPDAEGTGHHYSSAKGDGNTFSLSEGFNTFSYIVTNMVGKTAWEQNEVGICATGAQ